MYNRITMSVYQKHVLVITYNNERKNILVQNYQETVPLITPKPPLHHHPGPWCPAVTVDGQ